MRSRVSTGLLSVTVAGVSLALEVADVWTPGALFAIASVAFLAFLSTTPLVTRRIPAVDAFWRRVEGVEEPPNISTTPDFSNAARPCLRVTNHGGATKIRCRATITDACEVGCEVPPFPPSFQLKWVGLSEAETDLQAGDEKVVVLAHIDSNENFAGAKGYELSIEDVEGTEVYKLRWQEAEGDDVALAMTVDILCNPPPSHPISTNLVMIRDVETQVVTAENANGRSLEEVLHARSIAYLKKRGLWPPDRKA